MSGLETAIRNALDRSERGDGQVRARIYQSARQALDAGLRKQGVTDNLVIMQQRKRLEDKISEIENEEIDRLAQSAQPAVRKPLGRSQIWMRRARLPVVLRRASTFLLMRLLPALGTYMPIAVSLPSQSRLLLP
uniref:hypothetical protein n=1 Tax=Terrirhizobium terrae TaxID=2926709 RepID=UPI0035B5279B